MSQVRVSPGRITFTDNPVDDEPFQFAVRFAPPTRQLSPKPSGVRYVSGLPRDAAYVEMRQRVDEHIAAGIDPGVWPDSAIDAFFEDAARSS